MMRWLIYRITGFGRGKMRNIIWGISFFVLWFPFFGYAEESEKKDIPKIRLNEIHFTGGSGKSSEDFVEIYNYGQEAIDLLGWSLRKETAGGTNTSLFGFSSETILDPGEFFVWANKENGYAEKIKADGNNGNTLTYGNTIILRDKNTLEIDTYKSESNTFFTVAFREGEWVWVCNDSPGEENDFFGYKGEKTVRLEELLPDPNIDSGQNEFIELYNFGEKDVDLSGWFLSDIGVKKGLTGILKPGEYKAENFGISLNNTNETISLYDTCGGDVDNFEYKTSEKGKSWSFDGSVWRLTPYVTKGSKNIFPQKVINSTIQISEVFPRPEEDGEEGEFIELYNFGEKDIDISFWSLGDTTQERYVFPEGSILLSGQYKVVLEKDLSFTLNDSKKETVYLFDPADFVVDSMSYEKAKVNFSFIFDKKEASWKTTPYVSLGTENIFPQTQKGAKIRLNEILPNPKENESENEYIELYNYGDESIDISYWTVRDSSGSEYVFDKGTFLFPKNYLAVYRKILGFSLNNTKESIVLEDVSGYTVDSMTYESSKEDISWNRDDDVWRKSKHLTPNNDNKLNHLPRILNKDIPDKAYINTKTSFSVQGKDSDGDDISYRWEFGDQKKSYLNNTSHFYQKKGKYTITLRVSDGIEDIFVSQTITVSSYPKVKIKIIAFAANPEGRDNENEWIEIRNEEKKTIYLRGFSIATGKNKEKLTNHPMREEKIIRPGEVIKIRRTQSAFSLGNSGGVVEIRRPDGTLADTVFYTKDAVVEGEEYRLLSGVWTRVSTQKQTEKIPQEEIDKEKEDLDGFVLGSSLEKERYLYPGIFLISFEKSIFFSGYETKNTLRRKGPYFVFTSSGASTYRVWWKRCLFRGCMEG